MITDCAEISGSDLLATSSLDGFIRIWSLDTFKLKTELEDIESKKHPTKKVISQTETVKSAAVMNVSGIRCLSYTPEFGGNLVSCGYTNYINVWSPESSLSKAYMGKLEGHNGIVISCKIFPNSPITVSIDDKFTIRVWDIRSFTCTQTLRNDSYDPSMVSCLSVLPGESRFLVGGKRLLLFTNEAMQRDQHAYNEELTPLSACFNPYFNTFTVVTKHDLRLYDAFTGKLKKILNGLTDQKNHVDITSFQMGPRFRKFYVSDNKGSCKLFNFKSGELLVKVIEPEEDQAPQKMLQQRTKGKSKKEKQIIELIYVEEQSLIITALGDSTIKVYESKPTAEVELIKEMKGAHPKADITCAKYSKEVYTLYTGASDGTLACWSLASSRLVGYFKDEAVDITALVDLFPFPAVLAGNSRGMVTCWRTNDLKKKYPLIFKVSLFESASATPIRPVSSAMRMVVKKLPSDAMVSIYGRSKSEAAYAELAAKRPIDVSSNMPASMATSTSILKRVESQATISAAANLLLIGNGFGSLQVFSIDAIMDLVGLEPVAPEKMDAKKGDKGSRVALLRKDSINGENCHKILHEAMKLKPKGKTEVFLDEFINLRSWRAHQEAICSMSLVSSHIEAFISCGEDRFVKIWQINGQLLGQVNIVNPDLTRWDFPYNWVDLILQELDETFKTVEQLDRIVIGNKQREALQIRYLFSNFVFPEFKKLPQAVQDPKPHANQMISLMHKVNFFSKFGE